MKDKLISDLKKPSMATAIDVVFVGAHRRIKEEGGDLDEQVSELMISGDAIGTPAYIAGFIDALKYLQAFNKNDLTVYQEIMEVYSDLIQDGHIDIEKDL